MTTTSNRCSECHKEVGAIFCTGCKAYFCMKDLKVHREKLSAELDGIISERDELQEDINRATQQPISSSALILEIDKWKENMIKKVEEMAEQARERVTELLNEKRTQLTSEFRAFSQELAHRKESENFVEPDLVRLEQMVRQFNQELKQLLQPPTIELEIKEIDYVEWDFLISIGVKPNTAIYQEQQKPKQQPTKSPPQKGVRKKDSF